MTGETPMDPEERRSEINRVTERIISCVYRVSNTLGSGFLETGLTVCLLVNFGKPRVEIKRLILDR